MREKTLAGQEINESLLEARFIKIFREHEYKLYILALKMTKSDQYAKDIVQEAFLSLWDHRGDILKINNINAWLYRVTENKIMDFLRKAAVNNRLKEAIWENLKEILEEGTIALVEARECESIISKAIKSLPPQRQLIYRMNREKGLSYQEIADELHLSRHTVKNQLFSALGTIRDILSRNKLILFIIFILFAAIRTTKSCFVLF